MARMEMDCDLKNLGLTFQVVSRGVFGGLFSVCQFKVIFSFRRSKIMLCMGEVGCH